MTERAHRAHHTNHLGRHLQISPSFETSYTAQRSLASVNTHHPLSHSRTPDLISDASTPSIMYHRLDALLLQRHNRFQIFLCPMGEARPGDKTHRQQPSTHEDGLLRQGFIGIAASCGTLNLSWLQKEVSNHCLT